MLISLIGLPASGKSTIGSALARHLDVPFIDLDVEIERVVGMSITDYFECNGEAAFRDIETACLEIAAALNAGVLATGGGVVMRERNCQLLRQATFAIYLQTPLDLLEQRLADDKSRPLLVGHGLSARLAQMEAARDPLYLAAAQAVVRVASMPLAQAVDHVSVALRKAT